jgi:hypothetical protein
MQQHRDPDLSEEAGSTDDDEASTLENGGGYEGRTAHRTRLFPLGSGSVKDRFDLLEIPDPLVTLSARGSGSGLVREYASGRT